MSTRLDRLFFALGVAAAASASSPGDARASGGWFQADGGAPAQVREHRVALAIGKRVTTLWDQVDHSGAPEAFAWVLPVRGAVVVSVGDDAFLSSLDAQTAPIVRAPSSSCPSSSGAAPVDAEPARSVVGPYEIAQVHGDAATDVVGWLRTNGYAVATELEPVLRAYVAEGFGFVAAKLRPGHGVQAMRPIRVSFRGPMTSLPLRMLRAGVTDAAAIRLFVIGDGRFEPSSFPALSIDPAMLTWDFASHGSDYATIRDAELAKFAGRAFALESSVDVIRTSLPDAAPSGEPVVVDPGTDAPVDVGPPPEVSPHASDVELAFGTASLRRVTRLRGALPVEALDVDLALERSATQNVVSRALEARNTINDAWKRDCSVVAAPMPGEPSCSVAHGERSSPWSAPIALGAAAGLAMLRRRRR